MDNRGWDGAPDRGGESNAAGRWRGRLVHVSCSRLLVAQDFTDRQLDGVICGLEVWVRLPGVYWARGWALPARAGRRNEKLIASWTPVGGLRLTGVAGWRPVAWTADVWRDRSQAAIGAIPIGEPTFHRLLAEHAGRFLIEPHAECTGYRLHPLLESAGRPGPAAEGE